MEQVRSVLLGVGALALSPFLGPGLRPVAKSVVKGGMAVAEAAKGVAEATGDQLHSVISKTGAEFKGAQEPESPSEHASAQTAASVPNTAASSSEKAAAAVASATAPLTRGLRPIVQSAVKGGNAIADAATGVIAQASKQWNEIVADVQAERAKTEAGAAEPGNETPSAQPAAKETAPSHAAETVAPKKEATPESAPAPAAKRGAVSIRTARKKEGHDDLRQIKGIGPKTAALLQESGITTFEELAAMDTEQLRSILKKGGSQFVRLDPALWPNQARRLTHTGKK